MLQEKSVGKSLWDLLKELQSSEVFDNYNENIFQLKPQNQETEALTFFHKIFFLTL